MNDVTRLRVQLAGIFSVLFLASAFGFAAYEVSYKKGKISKDEFTVSQSLAYGDQPILLTLLTLGTAAYIYLLNVRGPKKMLVLRIFLQLVIFAFIASLLWIKPWGKYLERHRIFAAIIFFTTLVYHVLTYFTFKDVSQLVKILLLIAVIVNILVFIGLIVTNLPQLNKSNKSKEVSHITFASLENTTTLITGSVILIIAFLT